MFRGTASIALVSGPVLLAELHGLTWPILPEADWPESLRREGVHLGLRRQALTEVSQGHKAGSLLPPQMGALAGAMQLLDAGIGLFEHDLGKCVGPLFIAVLQFFVVYLLHRSCRKPSADDRRLDPTLSRN